MPQNIEGFTNEDIYPKNTVHRDTIYTIHRDHLHIDMTGVYIHGRVDVTGVCMTGVYMAG